MKYLLSNGIATDKIEVYLRDAIGVNFSIYPRDLPYNTALGVEKRMDQVSEAGINDALNITITTFINNLNRRHKTNLKLKGITFKPDLVKIEIDLGTGDIIEYNIT